MLAKPLSWSLWAGGGGDAASGMQACDRCGPVESPLQSDTTAHVGSSCSFGLPPTERSLGSSVIASCSIGN